MSKLESKEWNLILGDFGIGENFISVTKRETEGFCDHYQVPTT
jgi:hypothetical protein